MCVCAVCVCPFLCGQKERKHPKTSWTEASGKGKHLPVKPLVLCMVQALLQLALPVLSEQLLGGTG